MGSMAIVTAELSLGQLGNRDYQQDHRDYADRGPNPHASAHPSIGVIHDKDHLGDLGRFGVVLGEC